MLTLAPQTETVTNFKANPPATFKRAGEGPLMILQHSKPVGILISPERWNQMVFRVAELERLMLAKTRNEEMENNPSLMLDWETVKQELGERGLIDA